jgi:acetoin utilization protein AcuB
MDVESIMTRDVVTAAPNETIRSALRKLEDQEIRHLPVVDDGRLVGMLSDRDVREHRLPLMEELDNPDYADSLMEMSVAAVMKGGVISLSTSESVGEAIDLMIEYKVGAVPVVDGHSEELVGIVSYIDVLRALRPGL